MIWNGDFFSDVTFLPAVRTQSVQGADLITHPGPGVTIKASCQSAKIQRVEPDGRLVTATWWSVFLPVDPSALNGGEGIRTDDIIQYNGLNLSCQGEAVTEASRTDVFPLWRVECLQVV